MAMDNKMRWRANRLNDFVLGWNDGLWCRRRSNKSLTTTLCCKFTQREFRLRWNWPGSYISTFPFTLSSTSMYTSICISLSRCCICTYTYVCYVSCTWNYFPMHICEHSGSNVSVWIKGKTKCTIYMHMYTYARIWVRVFGVRWNGLSGIEMEKIVWRVEVGEEGAHGRWLYLLNATHSCLLRSGWLPCHKSFCLLHLMIYILEWGGENSHIYQKL